MSARMDGEEELSSAMQVDEHLTRCPACRRWQQEAVALTRVLRVRAAVPDPGLVSAVMAHAPAVPTRRTRWRRAAVTHWPRLALALVAAAQLMLGAAQVFGLHFGMLTHAGMGHDTAGMSAHLFNESTSWALAVGVGLLWAARRPRAATGVLPVLSVFVVALSGFVVHDLAAGEMTVDRAVSHLLLVAGLALLALVHRRYGRPQIPAPGHQQVPGSRPVAHRDSARPVSAGRTHGAWPLPPTGRHVA